MAIALTENAARQLEKVMVEQGLSRERTYLRVAYNARAPQSRRCSIELQERDTADSAVDVVSQCHGVEVRCDEKSHRFVNDITIDYESGTIPAGFTITKPPGKWPAKEPFAAPWIEAALRNVIDPEVGVNIVDLGLIYETRRRADEVTVIMTMTTPACPMTEMIVSDVKSMLFRFGPTIKDVHVELVWEPPWTSEMISAEAQEQMGWR